MHKDAEPKDVKRIETFINIVTGWHFFLSLVGLILLFFIVFKQLFGNLPSWLIFIGTISTILFTGASFFAGYQLKKRTRVGRTTSLVVNYLGFIFSFIALLQVLGVFLGVDALANTFGSGIGWLVGVLAGYLIHAAGDHFHYRIHIEEMFHKIGKYIALVSFIIFLFRVGLIKALIYLGKQIIIPTNLMIAFLVILFGIAIWLMWREETGIYLHRNNAQTEALEGYLFLSPNLLNQ